MKKKITFEVELDENNLPTSINMITSEEENPNIRSIILSAWDSKLNESLRIDLWTKNMMVNDMNIMFHQSLIGMANSLQRSTGNIKLSNALKDYCAFFAEQTKILK